MNVLKINIPILCVLALLLSSCQFAKEEDEASDKVVIQNNEVELAERVHVTSESIEIEITPANKASMSRGKGQYKPENKKSEITLTLVAEVDPLVHKGAKLHATEIRIHGNKAYVSYNTQGDIFLGGVEVIDISDVDSPELISSAVLSDVDVNGLAIKGSSLYLAAATSSESYSSPAILSVVKLSGGKLSEEIVTKNIASFAATDVDIFGSDVYVTSGADNGYITILSQTGLVEKNSSPLVDARSVDSDSGDIAVIAGSNGVDGESAKLITFDKSDGSIQNTFDLAGATIKHSKSTIEVKKDKAIVAMGDGGTQLICLETGEVLKTIDNPVIEGLDAALAVANAATAYKRSVFMANGEAGVYVAVDDENIEAKGCDTSTLEVVGRLALNNFLVDEAGARQSVNHIVYRNDVLFLAAGLGGLKVIKVEDSEADDDGDDS